MGLLCIVASLNDGKSGELLLAQGFPFDTMNHGFEDSSKPVFASLRANFSEPF